MEELSDEQLVARYRAEGSSGGNSFLDQLFRRHHSRVAGWCFRMTGEVDSAADMAQDIFLKAFQRLDSYRGESRFTTWLYSIARNHCMDEIRARASRPEPGKGEALEDITDTRSEEIWRVLERQESLTTLRKLMREHLDETEGKVMILHYVHELPLATITRMLGLTNQSGSKAFIVSAKRKLMRTIEQMEDHAQKRGGKRHD